MGLGGNRARSARISKLAYRDYARHPPLVYEAWGTMNPAGDGGSGARSKSSMCPDLGRKIWARAHKFTEISGFR